jgi:hypothetical protein
VKPPRALLAALLAACTVSAEELPDIRTVPADLEVPVMIIGAPAAGQRVRQTTTGWEQTAVYHSLYLPTDWKAGGKFPVIVEWPGNGGFRNSFGDECTGMPEGCKLGYGVTAGAGAIWVCAPFVDGEGKGIAETWWGTKPAYDPEPTLTYVRATVQEVCGRFGGDPARVVLAGFSRGSIATNCLGLHDDVTAKLWSAFICYSQYDGVRTTWPYPGADRDSAHTRLARLAGRPQFICGENTNADQTREYLQGEAGTFTFVGTGFRNHNDAWVLRPNPAREQLRAWFRRICGR